MRKQTLKTIYDYEELVKFLEYETNILNNIDPHNVYASTSKKLWFKTPNGISFERQISSVVKKYLTKKLMPFEHGLTISGYNGVLTTNIEIKELIDDVRNKKEGIDISKLSPNSGVKVYAKCSNRGMPIEDKRFLFSIVKNHSVFCNKCNRSISTSFQEQTIFYYIKKLFPTSLNGSGKILNNNLELDIYIPQYNMAIEYDGYTWHSKTKDKDLKKYENCKKHNIFLIRVSDFENNDNNADIKITVNSQPTNDDYKKVIDTVISLTNNKDECIIDIDIE